MYMELDDAINARRSIRKFKKGATIPKEDYLAMIEAGMYAPSARNGRPWRFAVIESRKLMDEIKKRHPYAKMLESASGLIVVLASPGGDESSSFFQQDAAACTENILLKATDLGYGTVWCGLYPIKERASILSDILGMPEIPVTMIAIGIPDENPLRRGVFEPERITFL